MRIGEDEVSFEVGVAVVVEGVAMRDLTVDASIARFILASRQVV
jgi:hypothetical protein